MLKVGVIGAGHLGRWHIKNLQQIEGVEFVGFFDSDVERAKEISKEYKASAAASMEELLENCAAISIVVPTSAHYEVARAALNRNVHVFCEKPFMETTAEADEIIALAKSQNLVLQVGHIERFNPALSGLREIPMNPMFIESHRIAPFNPRGIDVAVILDLMIHDIDIILSIVHSDIDRIDAAGAPILTDSIDIANARIKFKNGCVANITASRVSNKQMRKLRIFQKDAYISVDFLKNKTELYSLVDNPQKRGRGITLAEIEMPDGRKKKITYKRLKKDSANAMLEELRAFVYAIQNNSQPPVTGEDGKRALETAIRIEAQIKEALTRLL